MLGRDSSSENGAKPTESAKPADDGAAKSKPAESGAGQVTLQWDDSAMTTSYANVFNISMTRDEVGLFFGTNLSSAVGRGDQVTIKLSDRIIMTPHSTKRLLKLLEANVKAYEDRHGVLDVGGAG